MLLRSCILRIPKKREQTLNWLPHPAFLGPKRGRKCYVTLAFSGFRNAKRGEQHQNWSPTKGGKFRSGCLTPTFSGTPNRAEMPRHLCILEDSLRQARGAKSEVVPNQGA